MAEVAIPLAAPVVGEVVKILSTESTFQIRHKLALSKNLDETYEQLIQDPERLLQVEKDNEREVQRLEEIQMVPTIYGRTMLQKLQSA
ncbi:hypothetical protein L6164_037315 [Bauhinia variegata]|uniref:Uncharacterized protein n=1 Tax=Bauhinia variegata TaxID=167791 RepID=A0ACB9KJM1_BAUVA|nr:hypothetical protein L6164_037315 [Bauhinia variegata]